jgi:hypothetical protein
VVLKLIGFVGDGVVCLLRPVATEGTLAIVNVGRLYEHLKKKGEVKCDGVRSQVSVEENLR